MPATSMPAPRSIIGTAIQRRKDFITAPPFARNTPPSFIVVSRLDPAQSYSSRIRGPTGHEQWTDDLGSAASRREVATRWPLRVAMAGRKPVAGSAGLCQGGCVAAPDRFLQCQPN